jgi:hypothetical protein
MFSRIRKFLVTTYLWILLSPFALQITGAASNQVVLIANGDRFPVMVNAAKLEEMQQEEADAEAQHKHQWPFVWQSTEPDGMLDDTHCVMTSHTHLNALADIFDLHAATYSIGDFILMLGECLSTFAPFVWMFAVVEKLRKQTQ